MFDERVTINDVNVVPWKEVKEPLQVFGVQAGRNQVAVLINFAKSVEQLLLYSPAILLANKLLKCSKVFSISVFLK